LAGFTNPARALYMTVRELVENAMDACELAGITPNVYVRLVSEETNPDVPDPKPYRLTVRDNGPGVPPQHVPSAFGKVFYGSKYVLRQSRGMFGLGGTMAILYGQITTNRPFTVVTSPDGKKQYGFQMMIDIGENRPIVLKRFSSDADGTTGTKVDLALEGDYLRASQKINDYFKQTAMVASYANITYVDPSGQVTFLERVTNSMPTPPKETLPHPHGIDVEAFKRIVKLSEEHEMKSFMVTHFHRVGDKIATKFLEFAGVNPKLPPKRLSNNQVVAIVDALQRFPDFLQPDAACLSPVGEEILLAGINKELHPEFSTVASRPPSSYSGFPFLVEVGVAYGGKTLQPGVKLFRYANRIPLLYDECYSDDTRVLTRRGFIPFSQLTYEDGIATLNPSTGFLEYQEPSRIISYQHRGPMIHFWSPYVDLAVTPNHRMYCSKANRPFRFYAANEIQAEFAARKELTAARAAAYEQARELHALGSTYASIALQLSVPKNTVRGWLDGSHKEPRFTRGPRPHFYIKRDAGWAGEHDVEFFELPPASARKESHHLCRTKRIDVEKWLRFLGWYLAEGSSFRDKGGYVISLGLGEKDLRYKSEIDDCIRAFQVRPHWTRKGAHGYEIRFTHKQLYGYVHRLGHAEDKFIPPETKELPRKRLRVLLDALMKGDGTVSKHGSRVFGTVSSLRLAGDVAEIAIKCGYAVTFGYAKKGMCVYLSVKHKSTKLRTVETFHYEGKVWCATVPNHIMLVERGGKTAWSGNSSDVSFKVLNEEVDWKRYHVPQDAPVAVITHLCSTKIPYKTVGKEYIADRPEIERDIRNAAREALRRLGIFLSRKGSMEAVQRKMNIYGKYLPLIARFATELAGKRRPPNYQGLMGERETEASRQEAPLHEAGATTSLEAEESSEARNGDEAKVEQKKIDEYGGS
jgi:DNA topoisomerase-6 subunit B